MRITINVSGVNSARHLNSASARLESSVGRLSSGDRIVSAADDAAGLVISNRLRAQVSGLRQAMRNAQDGASITRIQDDVLGQATEILMRVRDLAVQAANTSVYDVAARSAAQAEVTQRNAELDGLRMGTSFGSTRLTSELVGAAPLKIHVGAGTAAADTVDVPVVYAPWVVTGDLVTDPEAVITSMDSLIDDLSAARATVGALNNRFEHIVASLGEAVSQVAAGESKIRDTDVAAETVGLTRNQVTREATSAMLAQTSAIHARVLDLLGS